MSSQVTYWHCGTDKACSFRNSRTCHLDKLIWVKTMLAKNDMCGPLLQFTLYLCQFCGLVEQERQVREWMSVIGPVILSSFLAYVGFCQCLANMSWKSQVLAEYRCIKCVYTWAVVAGSKIISSGYDLLFGCCNMLSISHAALAFMSILHGHSLSLMPIAAQVVSGEAVE